jgi:hypothetical protein
MSNDFYVTFISSVSDPLYDDLNKTRNFWTKISTAIRFEGRYEVALVDCILRNAYGILRKDCTYDIQVKPFDSSDWQTLTLMITPLLLYHMGNTAI